MRMKCMCYSGINGTAHTGKIQIHGTVGKTQNINAVLFQKISAGLIPHHGVRHIVFGAVQLDYKLSFCTIKICNIPAQYFLTDETHRIIAEKIIPEVPLFLCHILSQGSGKGNKTGIVFTLHNQSPFYLMYACRGQPLLWLVES